MNGCSEQTISCKTIAVHASVCDLLCNAEETFDPVWEWVLQQIGLVPRSVIEKRHLQDLQVGCSVHTQCHGFIVCWEAGLLCPAFCCLSSLPLPSPPYPTTPQLYPIQPHPTSPLQHHFFHPSPPCPNSAMVQHPCHGKTCYDCEKC